LGRRSGFDNPSSYREPRLMWMIDTPPTSTRDLRPRRGWKRLSRRRRSHDRRSVQTTITRSSAVPCSTSSTPRQQRSTLYQHGSTATSQPFQNAVALRDTIPGMNVRNAQVILAKIGIEMSRFRTSGPLASCCVSQCRTGCRSDAAAAFCAVHSCKTACAELAACSRYPGSSVRAVISRRRPLGSKKYTDLIKP